jgi:hypothetical protein
MNTQYSIHPRNWRENRGAEKKNTCAPRNKQRKGKLAKRQARLSARRISHSMTLKTLPHTSNPAAFKTPGSMKQKS